MTQTTPALDPDQLAQIQRLTQDYARFSQGSAGLGSVLGGIFAFLLLFVELVGYGGQITFLGAYAPLPLRSVMVLALLPFLWLGALAGLRMWWYQRHGRVEAESEIDPRQKRRKLATAIVMPLTVTALLLVIFGNDGPQKFLRAGIVLLLMAALSVYLLRVYHSRLIRALGFLLFISPALIIAGIQMAAGDSLLALPIIGSLAIVLGIREHLAFRRVDAKLAALRGVG